MSENQTVAKQQPQNPNNENSVLVQDSNSEKSGFLAWCKKLISTKQFKIWAILMGCVIIVVLSVTAVIMRFTTVSYGLAINVDDVEFVRVTNSYTVDGLNSLHPNRDNEYAKIVEIVAMLNKAGKSNELSKTFLKHGGHESSNFTSMYQSNIKSSSVSGGVYIEIVFNDYIYTEYVENGSRVVRKYNESTANTAQKNGRIKSIFIPLGNAGDSFSSQTWYFNLGTSTTSIDREFLTFGNYYKLSEYVRDEGKKNFNAIFYNADPQEEEESA